AELGCHGAAEGTLERLRAYQPEDRSAMLSRSGRGRCLEIVCETVEKARRNRGRPRFGAPKPANMSVSIPPGSTPRDADPLRGEHRSQLLRQRLSGGPRSAGDVGTLPLGPLERLQPGPAADAERTPDSWGDLEREAR